MNGMPATHPVEVVKIHLEPHPNADTLSIVRVHGWTCCVRTADWKDAALAAYIPPDSIAPETSAFEFLGKHRRIRVKRLRGVVSMGLLMPAPSGAKEGDDVADALGVAHYQPPTPCDFGGQAGPSPGGYRPTYDVENARRYADEVLVPGEPLWVTEKIHGANGRWCIQDGEFFAGSRTEWKRKKESLIWWQALDGCEELRQFLRDNPDCTVYGEVYGHVQDLKYGIDRGVRVAVFDILRGSEWLDGRTARKIGERLPWVPIVRSEMIYDWESLAAMAEMRSLMPGADHVAEGIVAKPIIERTNPIIGRVQVKVISSAYLERP